MTENDGHEVNPEHQPADANPEASATEAPAGADHTGEQPPQAYPPQHQPATPYQPYPPPPPYGPGFPGYGASYPTRDYRHDLPGYVPAYGHDTTGPAAPAFGHDAPATETAPAFQPPAQPDERQRRGGGRSGRTILIAAVTAAVVGGGIGAGTVALVDHNDNTSASGLPVSTQGAPVAAKVDGTITAAAAKIQPSVVTINVTGSQEQGTASGVIIRSDGYILTNDHVVSVGANGGSISVVTNDGQQAKATIVGVDASDDLAVIKVSGLKNLTAATFGKSSSLVVGQTVVAVGAPLGLSNTVTSGIVSNTARPVRSGDNSQAVFDAVQTDAAINPGNSGGPLVDLNGNVVGINAAIATANSGGLEIPGQSTQSGSIGIGFAIPADEASRIANELITSGKATHAVIGVTVKGSSSQSRPTTTGATINSVIAGGAAADAGLKAGDVVTAVNTQRIDDADGLIAAVRSHAPGETVSITYRRGGSTHTVQVKLGTASN